MSQLEPSAPALAIAIKRWARRLTSDLMILIAVVCCLQNGTAQALPDGLSSRYPAGSIQSNETAELALSAAAQERAAVEVRFASDERACLTKFFATSCVEDAKERRRAAMSQIRSIEVEANAYKRRARVLERDRAQSERRAQDEAEAPQRRQEQIEFDERAAKKIRDHASDQPSAAAAGVAPQRGDDRASNEHDATLKRRQTTELSDAKKRAENRTAYQKKLMDAEARQKEVASKKAQKEGEAAAREAASSSGK